MGSGKKGKNLFRIRERHEGSLKTVETIISFGNKEHNLAYLYIRLCPMLTCINQVPEGKTHFVVEFRPFFSLAFCNFRLGFFFRPCFL